MFLGRGLTLDHRTRALEALDDRWSSPSLVLLSAWRDRLPSCRLGLRAAIAAFAQAGPPRGGKVGRRPMGRSQP